MLSSAVVEVKIRQGPSEVVETEASRGKPQDD